MCSIVQKRFQRLEALCRVVVVAVTGEAEVDQFTELLALTVGQEPGTRAGKAVQPLRPQVEEIISVSYCLRTNFIVSTEFLPVRASSPKGNTTQKTTIIYCSKRKNSIQKPGTFQQCRLPINEIRYNSHPRHYPDVLDRDGNGSPISGKPQRSVLIHVFQSANFAL